MKHSFCIVGVSLSLSRSHFSPQYSRSVDWALAQQYYGENTSFIRIFVYLPWVSIETSTVATMQWVAWVKLRLAFFFRLLCEIHPFLKTNTYSFSECSNLKVCLEHWTRVHRWQLSSFSLDVIYVFGSEAFCSKNFQSPAT